jgi:hypothetical protein
VKPEIGPFRDTSLIGWQGKKKRAGGVAPAHELNLLFCFRHFVQPQRILRNEAAAVVLDFDPCVNPSISAMDARVRLVWLGRCFSRRRKTSGQCESME